MCRCSLTVLIFAGASHAVLLVCQSTSNVLPVIRNGKDCYSFPVFKVFLPGRNCCSRFYQCRLIQNEYLKKQSKEWLQTECINTQNAPFKSDPFSAVCFTDWRLSEIPYNGCRAEFFSDSLPTNYFNFENPGPQTCHLESAGTQRAALPPKPHHRNQYRETRNGKCAYTGMWTYL